METNTKALNSLKRTTVSIVTLSLIIVTIWTVLLVLFATGVFAKDNGVSELLNTYSGVTTYAATSTSTITDGGLVAVGAGISCTGLIGAGIGQGYAGGKAAEAVGRNPEAEGKIRNMMIVGAAIAESSALYALVIAIIILFAI